MGTLLIFLPLLLMVWWTLWEFFLDGVVLYRVAPYDAVPNVDSIVGVIAVIHSSCLSCFCYYCCCCCCDCSYYFGSNGAVVFADADVVSGVVVVDVGPFEAKKRFVMTQQWTRFLLNSFSLQWQQQ